MLLLGAMVGLTAAALTYATESFAEKKLEEHILEKKMSESSETNDFDDDDDIICEETVVDGETLQSDTTPVNEDDSICEECKAEEVETPEIFRHGATVKFREHDLARTADGINEIKDCTYKFVGYNPKNPLTCFITRSSKQRRFEVLIASLEIVE